MPHIVPFTTATAPITGPDESQTRPEIRICWAKTDCDTKASATAKSNDLIGSCLFICFYLVGL